MVDGEPALLGVPVIEGGCGTGVTGAELVPLGVPVIDGIDISPEMLAKAAVKTHESRLMPGRSPGCAGQPPSTPAWVCRNTGSSSRPISATGSWRR